MSRERREGFLRSKTLTVQKTDQPQSMSVAPPLGCRLAVSREPCPGAEKNSDKLQPARWRCREGRRVRGCGRRDWERRSWAGGIEDGKGFIAEGCRDAEGAEKKRGKIPTLINRGWGTQCKGKSTARSGCATKRGHDVSCPYKGKSRDGARPCRQRRTPCD